MKVRNVLFGYCYDNGKIVFNKKESEVMKWVFQEYRNGASLLTISQKLNTQGVEYMPGVVGWNKSRIMRLLEDKRYMGDDRYPVLISEEEYNEIQEKRDGKNSQKNTNRSEDIFQIPIPILCANCNAKMRRVVNNRARIPTRWVCQAHTCKMSIGKRDGEMLAELMGLLNEVIKAPNLIEEAQENPIETSAEIRRLNNEITRMFEGQQIDAEAVRAKMITYASLRYAEFDESAVKVERLKDIFMTTQPMQTLSLEFLERTADEIKVYADGTLSIILESGQEIKQEVAYAGSDSGTA